MEIYIQYNMCIKQLYWHSEESLGLIVRDISHTAFYNQQERKECGYYNTPATIQTFIFFAFKLTIQEESPRFYIVKHPMWKEELCTQRSWPLRTKNNFKMGHPTFKQLTSQSITFGFTAMLQKNRSYQRPNQKHSGHSRSGNMPLAFPAQHPLSMGAAATRASTGAASRSLARSSDRREESSGRGTG